MAPENQGDDIKLSDMNRENKRKSIISLNSKRSEYKKKKK